MLRMTATAQQGGGAMAATVPKRKQVFTKVDQLKLGINKHNLIVNIVSSNMFLQKVRATSVLLCQTRIAECLKGDETGTIIFTAHNEQVNVMKSGTTLILRNAKIDDMFKGSMRLVMDKWSRVEVSEPILSRRKTFFLIEYELVNVVEE